MAAHDVVVGADAARGDDHGLGGQFERADLLAAGGDAARCVVRGEEGAPHAARRALLQHQLVHPVAVEEGEQTVAGGLPGVADERLDDTGTGAPGDVEAGHGVAVAVGAQVAALGPADRGQQLDAVPLQPDALLPAANST